MKEAQVRCRRAGHGGRDRRTRDLRIHRRPLLRASFPGRPAMAAGRLGSPRSHVRPVPPLAYRDHHRDVQQVGLRSRVTDPHPLVVRGDDPRRGAGYDLVDRATGSGLPFTSTSSPAWIRGSRSDRVARVRCAWRLGERRLVVDVRARGQGVRRPLDPPFRSTNTSSGPFTITSEMEGPARLRRAAARAWARGLSKEWWSPKRPACGSPSRPSQS